MPFVIQYGMYRVILHLLDAGDGTDRFRTSCFLVVSNILLTWLLPFQSRIILLFQKVYQISPLHDLQPYITAKHADVWDR